MEISKRVAKESDTEFARTTHHAAYHDVVEKQFGGFDENMQDKFFFQSWKAETHEIIIGDGVEIGYCSLVRSQECIFVNEIVVSPLFQNMGVGSKILNDILDEARTKHIPVKLQVLRENTAQHLYRKLGFNDIMETETHIQMEYRP